MMSLKQKNIRKSFVVRGGKINTEIDGKSVPVFVGNKAIDVLVPNITTPKIRGEIGRKLGLGKQATKEQVQEYTAQKAIETHARIQFREDLEEAEKVRERISKNLWKNRLNNYFESYARKRRETVKEIGEVAKKLGINEYATVVLSHYSGERSYHTINRRNRKKIMAGLHGIIDTVFTYTESFGSDGIIQSSLNDAVRKISYVIQDYDHVNKKSTKQGEFFPYMHKIENDHVAKVLQELQIFSGIKSQLNFYLEDVCFIQSLKGQIPDKIINKIKFDINTEHVSFSTIKNLCLSEKLYIEIHDDKATKKHKFGNENSKHKVVICLIEGHYFKYIENTGITKYFIDNYESMKCVRDGHQYYDKNRRVGGGVNFVDGFREAHQQTNRYLNSFRLVKCLMNNKNKLLTDPSAEILDTVPSIDVDTTSLDDIPIGVKQFSREKPKKEDESEDEGEDDEKKPKRPRVDIYFDCETYVDFSDNHRHIPYMARFETEDETCEIEPFYGPSCMSKMLDAVADMFAGHLVVMWAHNATYDASFMLNSINGLSVLEHMNLLQVS